MPVCLATIDAVGAAREDDDVVAAAVAGDEQLAVERAAERAGFWYSMTPSGEMFWPKT